MDGSAFDSNQHISLLKAVDETFIQFYRPRLRNILDLILQVNNIDNDVDVLLDLVMKAFTKFVYTIFVKTPGV